MLVKKWLVTERAKARWLKYKTMVNDAERGGSSNMELGSSPRTDAMLKAISGITMLIIISSLVNTHTSAHPHPNTLTLYHKSLTSTTGDYTWLLLWREKCLTTELSVDWLLYCLYCSCRTLKKGIFLLVFFWFLNLFVFKSSELLESFSVVNDLFNVSYFNIWSFILLILMSSNYWGNLFFFFFKFVDGLP